MNQEQHQYLVDELVRLETGYSRLCMIVEDLPVFAPGLNEDLLYQQFSQYARESMALSNRLLPHLGKQLPDTDWCTSSCIRYMSPQDVLYAFDHHLSVEYYGDGTLTKRQWFPAHIIRVNYEERAVVLHYTDDKDTIHRQDVDMLDDDQAYVLRWTLPTTMREEESNAPQQ